MIPIDLHLLLICNVPWSRTEFHRIVGQKAGKLDSLDGTMFVVPYGLQTIRQSFLHLL